MDEKARSGRIFVWFSPVIPPIRAPIVIAIRMSVLFRFLVIDRMIRMGASFCQVIRIRFMFHLSFVATKGNHQWHGVIPSFIRRLRIRIDVIKLCERIDSFGEKYKMRENTSIIDAGACAIKYFMEASDSWLSDEDIIIGMNDNRLNSRPIQIISQLEDEIARIVPVISVEENKMM